MGEKTAVSLTVENDLAPSITRADVVSQNSSSLVDEVVSLLKGHLTSQLEGKGKQFERSAASDKEAPNFKYQGILKQFEVNLRLDKKVGWRRKKFKSSSDLQLFRAKTTIHLFLLCEDLGLLVGLPEHPTINLSYFFQYL